MKVRIEVGRPVAGPSVLAGIGGRLAEMALTMVVSAIIGKVIETVVEATRKEEIPPP